ncbi:MAG: HD domain-containing protein [Chitinophagales bacterium]
MEQQELIARTVAYVQQELQHAEGGHDWFHIERVWRTAKTLSEGEPVNRQVVELGALLHDIADSKFHNGDEEIGPRKAQTFLEAQGVDNQTVDAVINIIKNIGFKGSKEKRVNLSPELALVQDADRLDAIGAIGIARAFNFGGFKGRELYNPSIPPNLNMSKEEYKKSTAPTINHFYEKLLLLKDLMNTEPGKRMAEHRHQFMEQYLDQFYREWEGKS